MSIDLTKPSYRDRVDIGVINDNFTKIEEAINNIDTEVLSKLQEKLDEKVDKTTLESTVTTINNNIAKKSDAMEKADDYWYLTSNGEQIAGPYDLGSGGGGGGGSSVTDLTIAAVDWPTTIASGAECLVTINWSSLRKEVSTGNGTLAIYVNDKLQTTKKNQPQGLVDLNITDYLAVGTNKVEIRVTDAYSNTDKVIANIETIAVSLTSTFDATKIFSGTINYTYVPTAAVSKNVYFVIDDNIYGTEVVVESGYQQTYQISGLTHGAHSLKVYFTCVIGTDTITSPTLNYSLTYDAGETTPIITSTFNDFDQEQYVAFNIPYRVYTPNHNESEITLLVNGAEEKTLTVNQDIQYWEYRADLPGNYNLTIKTGEVSKSFAVTVEESQIPVTPVTQNLALNLTSYGRSNSEAHPEIWNDTDHSIECTLSNFNFVSDGWIKDSEGNTVLRVTGDARVTIPYKAFEDDFTSSGKTIELEFATSTVRNYESMIIQCWSGERGIYITPQLAKIKSQQSQLSTQYKEEDHVLLSFVIEKLVDTHLILMYINGIMCGAAQYPTDDSFRQLSPVDISIGSNDATVDLYSIRIYDNDLTRRQIVNNWIADTQSGALRATRYYHNNNYNDLGELVIDKLPDDLPYMIIETPILPSYKGDKKTVNVSYTDPTDSTKDFTSTGASADVQGTSSQYYYRKNFKIKYSKGFVNGGTTSSKYKLRDSSIGEKSFTYKADVASSESANNVELVKYFEDSKNWKTPPQKQASNVRVGIDGFPIVTYHNNGDSTYFYGKFNFNNDKGNNDTFGFVSGDESWEITNNNTPLVLFQTDDLTNWADSFESRYPETAGSDEHAYGTLPAEREKLQSMVSWVVSTKRLDTDTEEEKQAKLDKFKNELTDYFDQDSTLFYYLFTELFLMVDSRAKNAFPTYYISREDGDGGNHWFWIPYDMDTAIGINNEGLLVFNYNLEDTDTVSGAYVYNGQESVFWQNVRDAFKSELAEMYQDLRSQITVPWSYSEIEQRFENHQEKWSENIFNEDSYSKYIKPLEESGDTSYLGMLQGSKAEQRKWWLYNRFKYIDSKYQTGDAKGTTIMMRAYQKSNFNIVPYADVYLTANFDDQIVSMRAERDNTYLLKSPESWDPHGTDAVVGLYSVDQLKEIGDLSAFQVGYADFSKATKLQSLQVGSAADGYVNEHLTELNIGSNKMLATLDVRNCINLTQAIDISNCTNIEEVYFDNTNITGLKLPVGGILKKLHLSNTLTNLTIRNQKLLTDLQIAGTGAVETLWLENIPSSVIDAQTIIMGMPTNGAVRLIGFNQNVNSTQEIIDLYDLLDTMSGLNAQGEAVPKAQVNGKIYIDNITYADYIALSARYLDIQIIPNKIICTVTFMNEDVEFNTQNIVQGQGAADPGVPQKASTQQFYYVFENWDKDYSNIQADIVINAVFSEHTQVYTVKFDLQSPIPTPIEDQHIEYGQKAVKPTDPTISGSTFLGWYNDPSGSTGLYDFDTLITDNKTVYARWKDDTDPIIATLERLDYNKFKFIITDNVAVTSYAVTTSAETPTEWIDIIPVAKFEMDWTIPSSGEYHVWGKDAAGHIATQYMKAYDITTSVTAGAVFTGLKDFALEGTVLTADIDLDSHYENLVVTSNTYEIEVPYEFVVNHNYDFVATCTPKIYTVSFNLGGRGEEIDPQHIVYNHLAVLPDPQFVSGYIIENWYTSDTFETVWDFAVNKVVEDITLYAKWIIYIEPSYIYLTTKEDNETITCNFVQTAANGVVVDWNDGSDTETSSTVGNISLTHEYTTVGDHKISLTCTKGMNYLGMNYDNPIISPIEELNDVYFAWNMPYTSAYCFKDAVNLKSIELSRFMTEIAIGTFQGCTGLTSITIPSTIKTINAQAFRNCTGLVGEFTIPVTVKTIKESAFINCSNITKFNLPDDLNDIGEYAFSGCSGLTEFNIPAGLIKIPSNMLNGCSSITTLDITEQVINIGSSAFANCTSLNKVYFRNKDLIIDGSFMFTGCQKLLTAGPIGGDYNIEFSWIDSIPAHAFETGNNGSKLVSVIIPNTVTEIGDSAFAFCQKLTSINLPVGLKTINNLAFAFCEKLVLSSVPETVEYIGNFAFYYCGSLVEFTIPTNVYHLGNQIFQSNYGLKKVYIKTTSSDNKIETYATSWFNGCNAALVLYIPRSIPDDAAAANAYGSCWNFYGDGKQLTYYADLEG